MPARIFSSAHGGDTPQRRLPTVITARSTFATLILVVAVVGGLVGVIDSNPRHSLTQAAAAATPPATTSATASSTAISSTSSIAAGSTLAAGSTSRAPGAIPVVAPTTPVSQGQVGVIPVPLAPKAVAGPIPLMAWQAYHRAAAASGCQLPWYLLAGIGKVESDHGRYGGAQYDVTGAVHPAIFGPPTAYGRAMGPMQFIPPTWATYAADGNHDGKADPQNVFDATAAAAHYLCNAGGPDLSGLAAQRRAIFAYNHLDSYVADVLAFATAYENGQPERTVHLVPITNPKPIVKAPTTTRPTTAAPTVKPPTKAPTTTTTTSAPTTSARPTTTHPATTAPSTTAPSTTGSSSPTSTSPTSTSPTSTSPTSTSPSSTSPGPTPTCTPASTSASSAPSTFCPPPCPTPTTTPTATTPTTTPGSARRGPRSSPSNGPTCVTPTPTPTPTLTSPAPSGGRLTETPSPS